MQKLLRYLGLLLVLSPLQGAVDPVQIEITHFDPNELFPYTFPDGFTVELQGRAELVYRVCDPALENVVIEQTPDLVNWLAEDPLTFEDLGIVDGCHVYRASFQILSHPNTGADKTQLFRARW